MKLTDLKTIRRLQSWYDRLLYKAYRQYKAKKEGVLIHGKVDAVLRYAPSYRNAKLRGDVYRYLELGENLVVQQGRKIGAGLLLGTLGVGSGLGYSEGTGFVIRGMALGSDGTAEADGDTSLGSPFSNPAIGHHYHEIDSALFPGLPDTEVTFVRTFGEQEPQNATLSIQEYGLYLAVPAALGTPPVTTPPGPTTNPFSGEPEPTLVARKTFGVVTKSPDFTLELRWTLEF